MTEGANVYGVLLLFSFVCGAMLGALSDVFRMIRCTLFGQHQKTAHTQTPDLRSSQKLGKLPSPPASEFISTAPVITSHYTKALRTASFNRPKTCRVEAVVTAILDICFAVLSAITLILLVFQLNLGALRGFVPIIIALGFAAYRSTLSRPLTALTAAVIGIIRQLLRRALRILLHPILKLIQIYVSLVKHKQMAQHIKSSRKSYARRLSAEASNGFGVISE